MLRHFASFGECILDKLLLWCGLFDTGAVEIHGDEQIATQVAGKRGGLIICCHLGNLELCRVMSRRQAGLKLTVLLHTKHATRFNQLLAQVNPDSQLNIMQVSDLTPAAAALLQDKIDHGEFVAIAGDRIPVAREPRVAWVPFLGAMAPFPVGPYLMASLFQCPVYLLFSLRGHHGWEIHFELFRQSIDVPRKDRLAAFDSLASAYAARLEFYCRQAPLQWFNFYDFWQVGRTNNDLCSPLSILIPPLRCASTPVGVASKRSLRSPKNAAAASLSPAPEFRAAIARGADFLDRRLVEEGVIYGVTTGFGDSCTVAIEPELIAELPRHLYTFHGCGLGAHFYAQRNTRRDRHPLDLSVQGVFRRQCRLVGAAHQDLLSAGYLAGDSVRRLGGRQRRFDAAVLSRRRAVRRRRSVARRYHVPAAAVLADAGITPLRLRPERSAGDHERHGGDDRAGLLELCARRISHSAGDPHQLRWRPSLSTATPSISTRRCFRSKPHPGQQAVAGWLRQDLPVQQSAANGKRLQDRYSIRCAPHVIGVLADALPWLRSYIENELNSANDNPIIDAAGERVLHGGHFYGGHIAFAMDSMKNAVANLADLLDRQMALLVDSRYSNGLPANLSGVTGPRAAINHGLKALQISVSAWTAEALKLTMPASVFSRSTECHNQDKVSMGTIAARDCTRVLELTEQVAAGLLITVRQAVWLRCRLHASALPSAMLQADDRCARCRHRRDRGGPPIGTESAVAARTDSQPSMETL